MTNTQVLSVVFQLAHCVEQAEFPLPRHDTGESKTRGQIHQVETTVDFARSSRVAAWLLGGLNFQIEHHQDPKTPGLTKSEGPVIPVFPTWCLGVFVVISASFSL